MVQKWLALYLFGIVRLKIIDFCQKLRDFVSEMLCKRE